MNRGPILAFVAVAVAAAAAPAQDNPLNAEQAAALANARELGPEAFGAVYLTVYNHPELDRPDLKNATDFWVNSLSREANIVRTRWVTPSLLRLNLLDYGFEFKTWSNLANEDPYFHVQLRAVAGSTGKAYFPAEPGSRAGWYDARFVEAKQVPAIAPWLSPTAAAELVGLTGTAAPVLRADWFLSRVAAQAGRKGTGYYDFLGVKNRDDFDKLIGFNRKESQRVKKEVFSIVGPRSGVSNFPRQIAVEMAITGERFETRDTLDDNKDERNPIRNLDKIYKHQAEEIYAHGANDLYKFHLNDDKGVQQETAPDKIGFDKTAPGNDGRIHVGISCVRCHVEGLRPIADWTRRVFKQPLKLNSTDPEADHRIKQLYFGELNEKLDDSIRKYTRALEKTNGLTPEKNAELVGKVWRKYVEANILPADVAADLGVKEVDYLKTLRAAYRQNPLADPVLASHLAIPPVPIRADDLEQLAPLIYPTILKGNP